MITSILAVVAWGSGCGGGLEVLGPGVAAAGCLTCCLEEWGPACLASRDRVEYRLVGSLTTSLYFSSG